MAAREARDHDAMLAEARRFIAEDSAFVSDSIAFAATFTVDTVASRFDSVPPPPPPDLDGPREPERAWYVRSRRGAVCEVEPVRQVALMPGDTLRCQWTLPK